MGKSGRGEERAARVGSSQPLRGAGGDEGRSPGVGVEGDGQLDGLEKRTTNAVSLAELTGRAGCEGLV
jgi:hypothetical protein